MTPLLSITFPQGFRISKNIGHPTSGSGGKKTVKRYLKSEQTDRHTHTQTNIIWTFRLIESSGPEGRCFENLCFVILGLTMNSLLPVLTIDPPGRRKSGPFRPPVTRSERNGRSRGARRPRQDGRMRRPPGCLRPPGSWRPATGSRR